MNAYQKLKEKLKDKDKQIKELITAICNDDWMFFQQVKAAERMNQEIEWSILFSRKGEGESGLLISEKEFKERYG